MTPTLTAPAPSAPTAASSSLPEAVARLRRVEQLLGADAWLIRRDLTTVLAAAENAGGYDGPICPRE